MKSIVFVLFILPFCLNAQMGSKICSEAKQANEKNLNRIESSVTNSDQNIDALYYGLEIDVTNYAIKQIKGKLIANFSININSLKSIYLNLSDFLLIDSVQSSETIANFQHINNTIIFNFADELAKNQIISLVIFYHGSPISNGFGSFEFGIHGNQEPSIWSLSEPFGSPDWWPCKDDPNDKADSSDVWIICPNEMMAASNGLLISTTQHSNSTKIFHWKNSYPIANYLISIAVSNYQLFQDYWKYNDSDSMPIMNFIYPESFTDENINRLKKVKTMLNIFSDKFGIYPFYNEKYGHAQFGWGGGMEHQTCTSIGGFGDDLLAHELMHHWFGDMITCKTWADIWLNEGFASYGEAIYLQETEGLQGYKNLIDYFMDVAKTASGSVFVEDISTVNSIFNYSRSYAKGAVILHMLRGVLGDDLFFEGMKNYANSIHQYGNASTADFQQIMEDVSKMDLNNFFNQWIYGYSFPTISSNLKWKKLDNDYVYNLVISQNANDKPAYFSTPIECQLKFANGNDTIIKVEIDQQNNLFHFNLKNKISQVIIDPNNWLLNDIGENVIEDGDGNLQEPFFIFPNPANTSINIFWNKIDEQPQNFYLIDGLGKIIANISLPTKETNTYNLKIDYLSKGYYFIKMETNKGKYTQCFIKN